MPLLLLLLALNPHISSANDATLDPVDLTIKIQFGGGFFAELHKVIQTIIHYENRGFTRIDVDWRDEFFPYKDGADENGWDIFFEPITFEKRSAQKVAQKVTVDSTAEFHELHDQVCTGPWKAYEQYLPYRQFVKEKLDRYARYKPIVTDYIEKFYEEKMAGKRCIGVHARIARAHAWLVPGKRLPQLPDYYAEVDRLLEEYEGEDVVIFVASDSHHGVAQFKERYGDKVLHINAYRAIKDQDPCILYTHGKWLKEDTQEYHKHKHKTSGGLSTIWDCLLLAKCDHIIHTTSNLAFFATYYNPEIDSIYLPKGIPYKACRYKDDHEICRASRYINPEIGA